MPSRINESAAPKRRGRPKQAPEHSEVRQRLMHAGLAILTERGYSAVSLDEILKQAEAPKGCFYHYFKSKDTYVEELLQAYDSYFQKRMERCFDDSSQSPLARIQAFIREGIQGMQRFEFRRGCLVGNLGQEMPALPEHFRQQLIGILQSWEIRMAAILQRAQTDGEIQQHVDTNAAASFFWIGWEGAVLRAKLERSEQPLRNFTEHFFKQIEKKS